MKKLLILSGKGGTGKTTVASTMLELLQVSAFADCDVDAPNLHLVAGVDGTPTTWDYCGSPKAVIDPALCQACGICQENCRFGAISNGVVNEYSCEGCGVCQLVCPHGAVTLLDDISGHQALYAGSRIFSTAKLKMGRGNSGKLVTAVKKALIEACDGQELAILDGSPGIGCPVIASSTGVDLILVVAEPSLSGIHDMKRILQTADQLGTQALVCVNKYDTCPEQTAAIQSYCLGQGIPFVGKIPFDPMASQAINQGHTLAQVNCPARDAIAKVAQSTFVYL